MQNASLLPPQPGPRPGPCRGRTQFKPHCFEYDSCFLNTIHAQNATLIPFQIKRRVHDFQLNETEYDLAMIHIFPTNHAILHDFNQLRVQDAPGATEQRLWRSHISLVRLSGCP